jgi:uncharacterized protein (TIGR03437 family)
LDDLVDGKIPTLLAGVCVEVAGRRAPVFFVSPLQLNVQAPGIDSLGPVPVEVIRDCGSPQEQKSETQMVTAESVTPGFFIKGGAADGRNPIAALLFDPGTGGFSLLGDPAEIPGATPAVPGDIVVLFGTGFGPTDPAFEAGELPAGIGGVASGLGSVSVTVGEIPVAAEDIFYLGVAPGFAGLYQLNLRIPSNAPVGKLPVGVSVNGLSTLEGPYVSVSAAP